MKGNRLIYQSFSDRETVELGRLLGEALEENDMVALIGALGSGKTWFAKGIAQGLGVSPEVVVTSPSFSLVNEYEGRCRFFHMDAYRLDSLDDFLAAGLEDYFYQGGVVALEWADRWPGILPPCRVNVELAIQSETSRTITLTGEDARALEVLTWLREKI